MTEKDCILLAIKEANTSQSRAGAPIGAIIVKEGKVIAKGWSLVWPEKDPTSHAETNAIRTAYKKLQGNLSGCVLYSTLESCSMCLGCAAWAGLSKIVFGAYKEDVQPNPYEMIDYHAEEHAKKLRIPNGGIIKVKGGVLREACKQLMKNIKNWTPV